MRFFAVTCLAALLLMAALSRAELIGEHKDPRAAVLEMAAHYYSTQEVARQCGALLPEKRSMFDSAWTTWQTRNAATWELIGKVRDKRLGKSDRQQLGQLADTIRQQYATAPFDASMCETALKMLRSQAWDFPVKFPAQLALLKRANDTASH
ncbi:hypothetical protein [uncultured Oxalicibacterium sp.]|uniref:hypothetical protein n=1 Tax=uncultured Oxalicibacterium sp. TaxID=1168540 RepID=UPI0026003D2F|nr:hypothetical protein [uncultured Oxalicibacterium sp.]